MAINLHTWTPADKPALMALCNAVDRTYLSDRLPYPYTEADADWWLGMVTENDGKEGVWRAIVVDGQVVGSISVERIADKNHAVGSIGYGSADLRDCFPGAGAGAHNRRGVPGEPGIGPGAGEEWVPAGGNEGRCRCEGWEGDGCEGVCEGLIFEIGIGRYRISFSHESITCHPHSSITFPSSLESSGFFRSGRRMPQCG